MLRMRGVSLNIHALSWQNYFLFISVSLKSLRDRCTARENYFRLSLTIQFFPFSRIRRFHSRSRTLLREREKQKLSRENRLRSTKFFQRVVRRSMRGEQRATEENDENLPFLFLLVNDSDGIQSNRLNFLKTINSSSRISFNKKALFRTQAIRFLSLTGNIYYFAYGAFPTSIELNMTRLPMNKWPSGPVFLRSHIPRSPGQESELTFHRNN